MQARLISIHALREEGDAPPSKNGQTGGYFYPRPPRGGRPHTARKIAAVNAHFYPRPPRGGRHNDVDKFIASFDFYPRPPRGGRRDPRPDGYGKFISIHALREEGDAMRSTPSSTSSRFLSTPSARRATRSFSASISNWRYFYPRPPRGGRLTSLAALTAKATFLSTPSARRATSQFRPKLSLKKFLSTPSARRATSYFLAQAGLSKIFLSTPSARRATNAVNSVINFFKISIHALREEGDSKNRDKSSIFKQIIQHSARI